MKRNALILSGLLLPWCLWGQASLIGNKACTALVQDGINVAGQNRFDEALVAGISAQPRYRPTWTTLADLQDPGPAWTALSLKPKAKVVKDPKTGGYTVQIDERVLASGTPDSADAAVWLACGLCKAAQGPEHAPGFNAHSGNVELQADGSPPLGSKLGQ